MSLQFEHIHLTKTTSINDEKVQNAIKFINNHPKEILYFVKILINKTKTVNHFTYL